MMFFMFLILLVTIGLGQSHFCKNNNKDVRAFLLPYSSICCYLIILAASLLIKEKQYKLIFIVIAFVFAVLLLVCDYLQNKRIFQVIEVYKEHKGILAVVAAIITLFSKLLVINPMVASMVSQVTGAPSVYFSEISAVLSVFFISLIWLFISPAVLVLFHSFDLGEDKEKATILSTVIGLLLIYVMGTTFAGKIMQYPVDFVFKQYFISTSFHKNEKLSIVGHVDSKLCKNLGKNELINFISSDVVIVAVEKKYSFDVMKCSK